MSTMTLDELRELATRALQRAGASEAMASTTADALVDAEAQGLASHGLARVAQYVSHLRNGRAIGDAVATVLRERGGAVLVDARCGLAFPACALAVAEAIRRAREFGVSFAGVTNSHHFGVAAWHLRPVARAEMVGLAFGNSPAAMPAAGEIIGGARTQRRRRRERTPRKKYWPLMWHRWTRMKNGRDAPMIDC